MAKFLYNRNMKNKFFLVALFGILTTGGAIWYFLKFREVAIIKNQKMPQSIKLMEMETVTIITKDGVRIVGDYYPVGAENAPVALLLHMMSSTRKSWVDFAEKLNEAGFSAFAIDLRGHGDSLNKSDGTYLNYKNFSNAEHQSSIHDAEASVDFLKQKGANKVFIIGASIGANLALQYAAEHSDILATVLLSPGLDYRGVLTADLPSQLHAGQAAYFAASSEDSYSADSVRMLYQKTLEGIKKEEKIFDQAGHGTDIFLHEPDFEGEIISWLKTL